MKSIEKRVENNEKIIIIMSLLLLCLVGGFMNLTVMATNGGKMPFYDKIEFSSQSHFSFTNFSEIRYSYLADIIPIGNRILSIGDVVMSLSLILTLINIGINYKRK